MTYPKINLKELNIICNKKLNYLNSERYIRSEFLFLNLFYE